MLVQVEESEMQGVLISGGYMSVCTLESLVLIFAVGYFVDRIAIGVTKRLREIIHDKLMDLSMENSGKLSLSGLITRSTNGCYPISKFCSNGVTAICKSAKFWLFG